jgi:hypothetical protein
MLMVRFIRQGSCGTEEYGKVFFDGRAVSYNGLSDIFIKYLQNGVRDRSGRLYKPADGANFMSHLKDSLSDGLTVTDAVEI